MSFFFEPAVAKLILNVQVNRGERAINQRGLFLISCYVIVRYEQSNNYISPSTPTYAITVSEKKKMKNSSITIGTLVLGPNHNCFSSTLGSAQAQDSSQKFCDGNKNYENKMSEVLKTQKQIPFIILFHLLHYT